MLFHAIRSDCQGSVRAGTKVPGGLDCSDREPRAKSATAPRSSDKFSPRAAWSANARVEVRIVEWLLAGVLNSTAKPGEPAAVIRFISDGVVKRFDGVELSKPKARTS